MFETPFFLRPAHFQSITISRWVISAVCDR